MTNTIPAVPGNAPLPVMQDADFDKEFAEPSADDRGGMFTIGIAQNTSEICDRNSARYNADCEPGDLYILNAVSPIYKEMRVIPVWVRNVYVEWPPGRTGTLVAVHEKCPEVERHTPSVGRRTILVSRSTGNTIEFTKELYVLVLPELMPAMLPCFSTRLRFMNDLRLWVMQQRDETGRQYPAYSRRYRFYTVQTKNNLGTWYGLKFEDEGPVTDAQLIAAREFEQFVKGGNARVLGRATAD
jgi:hypothetical protein